MTLVDRLVFTAIAAGRPRFDFLKGNDIGIDFPQHGRAALGRHNAVPADAAMQVPGREPEPHGTSAGLPRTLRLPAAQPLAQSERRQRNHDHHSSQPGEAAAIRIADGFHQSVGKQRDGEHTG